MNIAAWDCLNGVLPLTSRPQNRQTLPSVWTSRSQYFILVSSIKTMTKTPPGTRRKGFTPLGIIFALAGIALFVYFVKKAGVGQIAEGISRLGAGFILILAISSVRHIVRSI